ncbi:MAG: rhomboid family intramembrane serine protease, partial [Gammaproteobacteria bacterium]|nr:rhomboid family intramembrane serine protease [Gammaproteobacteria bacterium]
MFIPLENKPDWRHPPFITLFLILINLICFVLWQSGDDVFEENAHHYYFSSGLAEIELPAYMLYLQKSTVLPFTTQQYTKLTVSEKSYLYKQSLIDGIFLSQLKAEKVITHKHPDFKPWKNYRARYEKFLNQVTRYKFGFQSAFPETEKIFTSLFLHADYIHLLGNMLFLFLFGFVLEQAIGRILLFSCFITGGIAANLITSVLEPSNAQWLVGASGAITTLAGIYIILFGMQKLRFFYTLIFYFDYIKAPAFIMLPVWVIYEILHSIISPGTVNAVTHLGGMTYGILTGFLLRQFFTRIGDPRIKNSNDGELDRQFQQGMIALSKTEFDKAHTIFNTMLQQTPDNINIIKQLFFIAKIQSDLPAMKNYICQLLSLPLTGNDNEQIKNQLFIDYFNATGDSLDLPQDLIPQACLRLCNSGNYTEAEKILNFITRNNPQDKKLPQLLLAIVNNLHKTGQLIKSNIYLNKLLIE